MAAVDRSALEEYARRLARGTRRRSPSRMLVHSAAVAEERDLHDGAQQQLVALSVALRAATSRLDREPGAARELLDEATHDVDAAIRELRLKVVSSAGGGTTLEAVIPCAAAPRRAPTDAVRETRAPAPSG